MRPDVQVAGGMTVRHGPESLWTAGLVNRYRSVQEEAAKRLIGIDVWVAETRNVRETRDAVDRRRNEQRLLKPERRN
jgi:hypothetical protein